MRKGLLTSTCFVFQPIEGEHFLTPESKIAFLFKNKNNGVEFSIKIRGCLTKEITLDSLLFMITEAVFKLEDRQWNNVIENVDEFLKKELA